MNSIGQIMIKRQGIKDTNDDKYKYIETKKKKKNFIHAQNF